MHADPVTLTQCMSMYISQWGPAVYVEMNTASFRGVAKVLKSTYLSKYSAERREHRGGTHGICAVRFGPLRRSRRKHTTVCARDLLTSCALRATRAPAHTSMTVTTAHHPQFTMQWPIRPKAKSVLHPAGPCRDFRTSVPTDVLEACVLLLRPGCHGQNFGTCGL